MRTMLIRCAFDHKRYLLMLRASFYSLTALTRCRQENFARQSAAPVGSTPICSARYGWARIGAMFCLGHQTFGRQAVRPTDVFATRLGLLGDMR